MAYQEKNGKANGTWNKTEDSGYRPKMKDLGFVAPLGFGRMGRIGQDTSNVLRFNARKLKVDKYHAPHASFTAFPFPHTNLMNPGLNSLELAPPLRGHPR